MIPEKEESIRKLRETVSSTDGFIAKAKRYTDIGCVGMGCTETEEPRQVS